MSYEEKIKRGLVLYLREVHGITAKTASIGESEVERGWSSGCDTCGYGSDEDTINTPIYYKESGEDWGRSLQIPGTSIDFLPELLGYIDRAN